jgi:hypothetical protein
MNTVGHDEIVALNREPDDAEAFAAWCRQCDVLPFLEREACDDEIVVYAVFPHMFLHAILVPQFEVNAQTIDPLLDWHLDIAAQWGFVVSADDVVIESPLSDTRSPLTQGGEKIVFARRFEGSNDGKDYYEVNQKMAHVLDLHHIEERDAWCGMNRHGDIDEICKIHRIKSAPDRVDGVAITMRRDRIGEFAGAGNYCLLRMFDFTRFRSGNFNGWPRKDRSQPFGDGKTVFGNITVFERFGSYSRGIQIIDVAVPKSRLVERLWHRGDEHKRYATFIALDWRHQQIGEFSCDPEELANYFVPKDGPFQTSPAFFRPEVLSKYKADSDKYRIEHGSISCRGSWYLKRFGVNDAGQIHAYLGDLGNLPYEEQLHWKQFNEPPKAGLSKSVIATDFNGEWSAEYDPLVALKRKLDEVRQREIGWWTLRDDELPRRVQYPLSDSRDDWSTELMNLDQLLVEGLEEKWLRRRAKELGRNPDDRLRALKLLEECLCGAGFDEEHARSLLSPWHLVHNLRSELKGHASSSRGRDVEIKARREHRNLVEHFRHVCSRCDESLEIIIKAIEGSAS